MSNSQGIGAAAPESGGSGVKAGVARYANEALSKVIKTGKKLLYAASGLPDCIPVVKPERVDNMMEEILSVWLEYCAKTGQYPPEEFKYNPDHNNNLGPMIAALIEACNPIFCGPSNCVDIPEPKKLWYQTDTKKLMGKCAIPSDDCCDDYVFWSELAGIASLEVGPVEVAETEAQTNKSSSNTLATAK